MAAHASAIEQQDRTILLLVLSVLSFLLGPLTGVPAWFMAHQDIQDVRMGILDPSLEGRLRVARTLSIIGTFVNVFTLFFLLLAGMVAFVLLQVMLEGALS